MKNRIMKICEDLCYKKITPDEQLIMTGLLDSYKIMELICMLEKEFHITLLREEISNVDNFSCVNSIMDLVNKKFS